MASSVFFHICLHIVNIAELVAHGIVGFLVVGCTVITGFFVEVTHRGPATGTRTHSPSIGAVSNGFLREVDITKHHFRAGLEHLRHFVPGRRLNKPCDMKSPKKNPTCLRHQPQPSEAMKRTKAVLPLSTEVL